MCQSPRFSEILAYPPGSHPTIYLCHSNNSRLRSFPASRFMDHVSRLTPLFHPNFKFRSSGVIRSHAKSSLAMLPSTKNHQPTTNLVLYHTTKTHLSGLPGCGIFATVYRVMNTASISAGDSPGNLAPSSPDFLLPRSDGAIPLSSNVLPTLAFVRVSFPGPSDHPTRHPAKQTAENPNPVGIPPSRRFRVLLFPSPLPRSEFRCSHLPSPISYHFPPFSVRRRETGCQKVPKGARKCQKVPESAKPSEKRQATGS